MKRSTAIILAINLLLLPVLCLSARAYWVWTPETKKFINPKYAVKDTPKEQYDWAMDFYNSKDYQRSAIEFEKLVKNYEYSEYAADSQYRVGLSYDNMGKYYIAFQNYQKAVDNFPHVSNIDEIIAREFNIGNIYASKNNPKVMGAEIMTSFDRAIEIYKKVVDNAPFGKFADEAQFKMAAAMKDSGRYDEAALAFQKLLDDYPASKLYGEAKYEMANSAYKASLSPSYDAAPTDKALKAFEEFANTNADQKLTAEAHNTIKRLKNKAAEKSFMTAEFYERQKRYASAIIYYQDVIDNYPDSISAEIANVRIADLKGGKYSHKSKSVSNEPVRKPVRNKERAPWFGIGKKKDNKSTVRETVSAPAAVSAPAEVKQAQDQIPEKESITTPVETIKAPAGNRWWAFGLSKKSEGKIEKPIDKKVKKTWAPLNFDTKTEGMKKDG